MPESSGGPYEAATLVESGGADVVLSHDQTRLYVALADGNIQVFDVATRELVSTWDVGASLGGMSLSADGSFVLVVERNAGLGLSTVYRVSTADGSVQTFSTSGSAFHDVEVVDTDTAILTGGADNLRLLDLTTGQFSTLTGGIYYSNTTSPLVEDGRYTLIPSRESRTGHCSSSTTRPIPSSLPATAINRPTAASTGAARRSASRPVSSSSSSITGPSMSTT